VGPRQPLAVAVAVALSFACATPARAQDDVSAAALDRWIAAIAAHVPGRPDSSTRFIVSMTYADRRELQPAMDVFLEKLNTAPPKPRTRAETAIFAAIQSLQQNPGVSSFLRRAAILHTDAAMFRIRYPQPLDDVPAQNTSGRAASNRLLPTLQPRESPLLSKDRFIQHLDGRVVGDTLAEWNWPFARSLLDLLPHSATANESDRAFTAEWYHAVAAYLLVTGHHGDLDLHLKRGGIVLPADARLLFDRGCYAEVLGLPIYQELSADPSNSASLKRMSIDVPAERLTDGEAESLFHQALAIDPQFVEARVRLARLLERRGKAAEAADEIDTALAGHPDRQVAFYARLVAGRIALRRGRPQDALAHYTEALNLYPNAQSALVGASHAAAMASDVSAAVSFVQRLGSRSSEADADPWWQYRFGAGRDVNALMAALWPRVTAR